MKLVAIAAFIAVCGAAKLDRTYLPPSSASTAGGNSDSLQTPLSRSSSSQGESSGDLPTGSYTNSFQGVVVDAATAGTRSSPDGDQSGLGGPRDSYGSTNSKVGDAAFRGSLAGFRNTPTFETGPIRQASGINVEQNFGGFETKSERPQAFKDRNSNIISYANDVSSDNYSYGFESDNGIAVGENGVSNNGIQAQGGYSYQGDDGQVYEVTYVADEGGYRPQGAHLPTPPPIPKEILESLEQNAKEEAAGLVDDGSYDPQKYNAEGDYTHHNSGSIQYNGAQLSQFTKRPESDATSSSTFINQHSQAFGQPEPLGNTGTPNNLAGFNGQSNQFNSNKVESSVVELGGSDKQSIQSLSGQSFPGHHSSSHFGHGSSSQPTSEFSHSQNAFGNKENQIGVQNVEQASTIQTQSQSSLFGSQTFAQGSSSQFVGQPSQTGSQVNREETSQFGAQPNKPSIGHGPNFASNTLSNHGTHFGNHASNLQGTFNSPSLTQNSFGTSQVSQTQLDSQVSNQPSFGSPNTHKQVIGQGLTFGPTSTSNDHFPNSPNQFGAEYLPPYKPNEKPSYTRPQVNNLSSIKDSNKNSQDLVPLQGQKPVVSQSSSASALASQSSAEFESQPLKPLNSFGSQFSKPNQFNFNKNQVTPQKESTIPTAVPQTELTTPLEPNEKPAFSQGMQFNGQSPSFGTTNNQALGFQNTASVTQKPTDQALSPSFTNVRPQMQFGTLPTQAAFTGPQGSYHTGKPQHTQNSFTQTQQNAYYSTQKPSFSQGPDDSYYYNQPSKPFNIPTVRPDPPRFPTAHFFPSNGPNNGITSSQNNQFFNQQNSLVTPSLAPFAAPTSSPEYAQEPAIPAGDYYNGITQAAISPFPSTSPTLSSNFDSTQGDSLVSKPSLNQQSSAPQFNKPTGGHHQQPSIPSFPTKPLTTFGQNPSTSYNHNQAQFEKNTPSSNYNQPSSTQALPSKPVSTFGQATSTNQFQSTQISPNKQNQLSSPEISEEKQTNSNQQYQGTIYEYNKPPEVLPPPEQSDSTSSQSSQTDTSLSPKKDTQNLNQDSRPEVNSQFGQSSFPTQTHQFSATQGAQNYKPLSSLQSTNTQFGQNSQPSFNQFQQNTQVLQGSGQTVKPNETPLSATTQFSQVHQAGLGSGSQFSPQPEKPFSTASKPSQFNHQSYDSDNSSGFTSSQTQAAQPIKPGSVNPTTSQYGQITLTGLGTQSLQQNSQPYSSTPQNSQIQLQGSQFSGLTSMQQNSQVSQIGIQPFKPFGTSSSSQGSKPTNTFGDSGTTHSFQGYPLSKPPTGNQLSHTQFTQTSQQTFGAPQLSSQPPRKPVADSLTKPEANVPSNVSPSLQKPQFGQITQLNQGYTPFGSSIGQQALQGTQYASTTSKPQFDSQTQFGQKIPTNQQFSSASSQAQFGQNSAQVSSSAQSQSQSAPAYKPFSSPSSQDSGFHNKPQFDQAPQSSGAVVAQSQFGAQPFKPFGSSGPMNNRDDNQNKPLGSQQGGCCQGSTSSAIAPLNVGKPSQAFAQTQSQFTGFQGAQGLYSQSFAGKGEEFGGPRQPPSFDAQTGYHY